MWSNLVQFPEACQQSLHCGGRSASHRGGTIHFSTLAFGAGHRPSCWRNCPAIDRRRQSLLGAVAYRTRGYRRVLVLFFLTDERILPARIAFCSVFSFTSSWLATSDVLAPSARSSSAFANTSSTSTAAPRVARGA